MYAMSVFKIPKSVCKDITDAIARFWWGDDENTKRMHWWAWWKLCFPKKEGGMGFWDLHSFNLAMLAKQCWRLLDDPEYLCARILRGKYYPSGDLLSAGPKKGSSFTWQSIFAGIQTFKRGHIWRVGSGEKINIWEDHWIRSSPSRKVITPRNGVLTTKVNKLIDPMTEQWDEELIRDIFNPVDVTRILQIPLSYNSFEDFVAWNGTSSGYFSVRSAYHCEWKHQFRNSGMVLAGPAVPNPVWSILKMSCTCSSDVYVPKKCGDRWGSHK